MKKNIQIATISVFLAIIFGLGITQLLLKDGELSTSEKRYLAQMPEYTTESLIGGEYATDFEEYLLDQFPLRDEFRSIKAGFKLDVLRQKDNNGIFIIDNGIYKWESETEKKQINYFIETINSICDRYLKNNKMYYTIIPDKNYFVDKSKGYPSLDYTGLMRTVTEGINRDVKYIDIMDKLTIDAYYRTDTHWRQDCLEKVVTTLGKALGVSNELPPWEQYRSERFYPFFGVYSGQAALKIKPDTITYMTNDIIERAVVTGVEFQGKSQVYTPEDIKMDSYNIFLKGPQAILEINNSLCKNDKELVIFRDSFGSSLAPLLIGAYSKVILIDLRYISRDYLADFVEFGNADVMFIYSTDLVNSGMLLK